MGLKKDSTFDLLVSFVVSWGPLGPQEVPRSPQGAPQDTFFTILGRRCTYFPAVVQNVRKKVKENTDAPSFDGRQQKRRALRTLR